MNSSEDGRLIFFQEAAMTQLDLAQGYYDQGRKAKAQEHFVNAMYYAQKVPAEFTDRTFKENMTKLNSILYLGY